MENELDKLAESVYDYCCSNRLDNLNKDGSPGDPRKVGCKFEDLWESPKDFYRNVAKWHLKQDAK
jgi:hypothetical protein